MSRFLILALLALNAPCGAAPYTEPVEVTLSADAAGRYVHSCTFTVGPTESFLRSQLDPYGHGQAEWTTYVFMVATLEARVNAQCFLCVASPESIGVEYSGLNDDGSMIVRVGILP